MERKLASNLQHVACDTSGHGNPFKTWNSTILNLDAWRNCY